MGSSKNFVRRHILLHYLLINLLCLEILPKLRLFRIVAVYVTTNTKANRHYYAVPKLNLVHSALL